MKKRCMVCQRRVGLFKMQILNLEALVCLVCRARIHKGVGRGRV